MILEVPGSFSNIDPRRNSGDGSRPSAISPPASKAEFRTVPIEIEDPDNVRREAFKRHVKFRAWGVYQRLVVVNYPLHDACF